MAYDESLATRDRGVLSPVAGFSEKKMFGGLCFLIHGNMCRGVLKDELVPRLELERAQESRTIRRSPPRLQCDATYFAFFKASTSASTACRSL